MRLVPQCAEPASPVAQLLSRLSVDRDLAWPALASLDLADLSECNAAGYFRVNEQFARQLFNDSDADSLWLVVGAPREGVSSTLEMTEEQLAAMYPDGPKAMPPELGGGAFDG